MMHDKLFAPTMNFRLQGPDLHLKLAAAAYEKIWQQDKERIARVFYELTGLTFQQRRITAKIFRGASGASGTKRMAMELGSEYYPHERKAAALTHELGHRLLGGNKVWTRLRSPRANYDGHRWLDLFLYDAWVDLYGKKFADEELAKEMTFVSPYYAKAWRWALDMTFDERRATARRLVKRYVQVSR